MGKYKSNRGDYNNSLFYSLNEFVKINGIYYLCIQEGQGHAPESSPDYWIALKGDKGDTGASGVDGVAGPMGDTGAQGEPGSQGEQGPTGESGPVGDSGPSGSDGTSAYQVWLNQGNGGSEQDFLNSLHGANGNDGVSLNWLGEFQYQQYNPNDAVSYNGSSYRCINSCYGYYPDQYIGSYWQIIAQRGNDGQQGPQGNQGEQGPQGNQGNDGQSYNQGPQGPQGNQGEQGPSGSNGMDGQQGPPGQGLNPRGEWNSWTSYNLNDLVSFNGASYIGMQYSYSNQPDQYIGSYWTLNSAKGNDGAPGLSWIGDWNSETYYNVNDAVTYNGSSWRCISAQSGYDPQSYENTYWSYLARKGDSGASYSQQSGHGEMTASENYGQNESIMLQDVYNALRNLGLIA